MLEFMEWENSTDVSKPNLNQLNIYFLFCNKKYVDKQHFFPKTMKIIFNPWAIIYVLLFCKIKRPASEIRAEKQMYDYKLTFLLNRIYCRGGTYLNQHKLRKMLCVFFSPLNKSFIWRYLTQELCKYQRIFVANCPSNWMHIDIVKTFLSIWNRNKVINK